MGKIRRNSRADNPVLLDRFWSYSILTCVFRDIPISKVWNRSDTCSSYGFTSKMGKIEEIQGQITQFRLTDFVHIRTWPVFSRDLPISKFETNQIIFVCYRCNTSKMGKIEEIQGQITQFRLTNIAHIRTWPVFPRDIPIPKFETDRIKFVRVIVATPKLFTTEGRRSEDGQPTMT